MGKRILIILLVLCCDIWATDGSAFTGHGPNQEGVAGAGAAKAQDSTWINLNPASIIELQSRFDVSLEYDRPNRRTEMRGLFANTNVDQDTGKSFIPNLSMVSKINHLTHTFLVIKNGNLRELIKVRGSGLLLESRLISILLMTLYGLWEFVCP